jgi:hypothetical protein
VEEVLPKEAKIIPLVKVNQKQKTLIDKVVEEADQEKNKPTETAKTNTAKVRVKTKTVKTDTATKRITANKNKIKERTARVDCTRKQTHLARKCIVREQ